MTADEEKDPPVPSFLEGVRLRRVHDGQVLHEDADADGDDDDDASVRPAGH